MNRVRISELNSALKTAIFFFCLYCTFGPFVNLGYHISKKGIGVENVKKYYIGSEEEMIPGQSLVSILEVIHFHTWAQASAIFILSAIFSISSFRYKSIFILLTFLFSIGHIFLPYFVRFIHPNFSYFLFITTFGLSFNMIFMSLRIIMELFPRKNISD